MALGDSSGAADALDATVQEVLERAPCDVALLVARTRERRKGPILAAFGGAEHDWMALELSAWIASATGSSLKLIGPVADPTEGRRDASKLLAHASIVVQRFVGIPAEPVLPSPEATHFSQRLSQLPSSSSAFPTAGVTKGLGWCGASWPRLPVRPCCSFGADLRGRLPHLRA